MMRRPVLSRRAWLQGAGAAAAVPAAASAGAADGHARGIAAAGDFAPFDFVSLNNAGTHPLPRIAARALRDYADLKAAGRLPDVMQAAGNARASFAAVIGAALDEIAIVQSTSAAETLLVQGLDLPRRKGNVVTDDLHHEGSLFMYGTIRNPDLEIRVVRSRNGRIDPADVIGRIDGDTILVALSLVSWVNGFRHDLQPIAAAAHANGALLYADIVQGAGAVPFDVKAEGADVCGCGTYKWLMGDTGLGFAYVRDGLLGTRIKRATWGWEQLQRFSYHTFPLDPPHPDPGNDWPMSWQVAPGAPGYLQAGTPSFAAIMAAEKSLSYLQRIGVDRIAAHVRPLLDQLQHGMKRLGLQSLTPAANRSPIATFLVDDPAAVGRRLREANVRARLWTHQLRVSPALYNDTHDIDALLAALHGL